MRACLAFLTISTSFVGICADETPIVTNVQQAISAPDEYYENGTAFRFHGKVLANTVGNSTLFADGTGRTSLTFELPDRTHPAAGSVVDITGVMRSDASGPRRLFALTCTKESQEAPETPIDLTIAQLLRQNPVRAVVRTSGTVVRIRPDDVDANYTFVTLSSDGQSLTLACYNENHPTASLNALLNAKVRATGVYVQHFDWKHFKSSYLLNPSEIEVLVPAPKSPFDLEPLANPSRHHPPVDLRGSRRSAHGTVLAVWQRNRLLMATPDGLRLQVHLAASGSMPTFGSSIIVAGLVDFDGAYLLMRDAIWKANDTTVPAPSKPRDIGLESLFLNKHGKPAIQYEYHGQEIRVRGKAISVETSEGKAFRMLVTDGSLTLPIDASGCPQAIAGLEIGSEIAVCGICLLDFANRQDDSVSPEISGIRLVVRTPEDITILSTPSPLTARRLMVVSIILLAVVIVILIWNQVLRTLVRRRSRELFRSQIAQAESQLRIDERTRLAAELHDYTAQNLTVVAYQISEARTALGDTHGASADRLDEAARTLKSCRTSLRRCLWDLRSDVLDEPDFAEAIRRTVVPVARNAKVSVRFEGLRSGLNDITAHAILSILRELAANAAAHGQAKAIRIAGECRSDGIRFSVQDDGCGFDPKMAPRQDEGHFGLDGIRERLEHLDGSLAIDSKPGNGTYIRLTLRTPQASAPRT